MVEGVGLVPDAVLAADQADVAVPVVDGEDGVLHEARRHAGEAQQAPERRGVVGMAHAEAGCVALRVHLLHGAPDHLQVGPRLPHIVQHEGVQLLDAQVRQGGLCALLHLRRQVRLLVEHALLGIPRPVCAVVCGDTGGELGLHEQVLPPKARGPRPLQGHAHGRLVVRCRVDVCRVERAEAQCEGVQHVLLGVGPFPGPAVHEQRLGKGPDQRQEKDAAHRCR